MTGGGEKGEGLNLEALDLAILIFMFGSVPGLGIGIALIVIGSHLFPKEEEEDTQEPKRSAPPTEPPAAQKTTTP